MISQDLIAGVDAFSREAGGYGTACETGVEGFYTYCASAPSKVEPTVYEPLVCLVLQGAKAAQIGGRTVRYGAGASLIVSHAVPVCAGVVEAGPQAPFVSLALRLDLALVRSLYDEIGPQESAEAPMQTLSVCEGDAELFDAAARLFRLSQDPVEVRTLAPLVLKEIHFRLLRARHGGMLRQLLLHESPASRISKSIALIRQKYRQALPVAELAAAAGMSASSFHEHFKTLTATTPLQYQKDLRLLEARSLLLGGGRSVASAAYEVGYESATQFSREYARKFGLPPRDEKPKDGGTPGGAEAAAGSASPLAAAS